MTITVSEQAFRRMVDNIDLLMSERHTVKNLRDEFAMAAMQGAIAYCGTADFSWCYEVADKMLLVRKEKP